MPEWSNGAVSKTVELLVGSGGSNPPLSAERPRRYQRRGLSAERGGWPTKSAWFYPHPDLPRGEGLVASLRIRISAFFSSSSAKPAAGGRGCATEESKSPKKRGMADKVGLVLSPSRPSQRGRLSRFAPRGQWSGVSAEFSSPSRSHSVVEWLFRRILAMGFLDGIVSPATFHNGSNFRISLPRPPSTTAAFPAILCRCGMAFPPHPCYGLPGRHCLPSPLPQRQHFPRFSAVVELLFRRILAWASWTALSPRAPSTTALITAFSCRCGKDRRAHLPKVIRILPDLARLRKVG